MIETNAIKLATLHLDGEAHEWVVPWVSHQMSCTKWIPKLTITMGNYSMTNDFFMVDVPDTNAVLGVQWIYSIGIYTTNQRTMEMEFIGPDVKKVVL
jgi:hypothetical protein